MFNIFWSSKILNSSGDLNNYGRVVDKLPKLFVILIMGRKIWKFLIKTLTIYNKKKKNLAPTHPIIGTLEAIGAVESILKTNQTMLSYK